jgi:hypothetical protein
MLKFTVLKDGKPSNNFTWNEEHRSFLSDERGLSVNFGNEYQITIKVGSYCTVNCGLGCIINGGHGCSFTTGEVCTFITGSDCTFHTGYGCIFSTGHSCIFSTGLSCLFNTGHLCTFTVGENCYGTRYDVPGINELPPHKTVKYNRPKVKGFVKEKPTRKRLHLTLEK